MNERAAAGHCRRPFSVSGVTGRRAAGGSSEAAAVDRCVATVRQEDPHLSHEPVTDPAEGTATAASILHRAGVRTGTPVVVRSRCPLEVAAFAGAAWAIGAPLVPLDPDMPTEITRPLTDRLPGRPVAIDPDDRPRLAEAIDGIARSSARPSAETALILATSGSDGPPKAVVLTHGNLRASAHASARLTPLAVGDRWLACLPPFHVGGFSILVRCALARADVVAHRHFDPQTVIADLDTAGITHLSLVPTMLAALIEHRPSPPPALRRVLVGGAALGRELARRAIAGGWPISPTWGTTETASQVATLPRIDDGWSPGRVGRPIDGTTVRVTPEGRLAVRGPTVMAGYCRPDGRLGDGLDDGWFVTGDLGRIEPDGSLVVLGRADDVIVSGGKKIVPTQVEDLLAPCPGLVSAAIVGVDDARWGQIVAAVHCGTVASDDLLAWCRAHLPSSLRPRRAIRLAALPLLGNGKPDRRALRRLVGNGSDPDPVVES